MPAAKCLIRRNPIPSIPSLILLLLLLSCSSLGTNSEGVPTSVEGLGRDGAPKRVAVLPFENFTEEEEIEVLVRKSFYSHFCLKSYHDVELSDVDRILQTIQTGSAKGWKDLSPLELGPILHADLLVYGRVVDFSKTFLGIYSQISLKVEVEIVDSSSGKGVWWRTIVKRSHEGGIPFSFFSIIPEALRTGLHMQKGKTLDLVERLTRELVEQVPDLPGQPLPAYYADIQVASFADEALALRAQNELVGKGMNSRVEKAIVEGRLWHRVLVGPYHAPSEAENARIAIAQDPRYKPFLVHHPPVGIER